MTTNELDTFNKAMDDALAAINKQYGKGTIVKLKQDKPLEKIPVIPTSIPSLDQVALGVGGVPCGRIVEIYGPESSGKTTLTLMIIAEAQRIIKEMNLAKKCAFIDAEHALDLAWAQKLGVDTDDLLISQPDNGEQGLDVARKLIETGLMSVVVIDSVSALTPQAELDGEIGDSHVGRQARLMSQALRILNGVVSDTGTVLIFINQIREKIGIMFGNPETTTGGRALKFYASVRMDIRRAGAVKNGDEVTGSRVKVKVVKNKVGAPHRETEFDLMYADGPDKVGNLVELAITMNLIEKSGAWFTVDEQRFQGQPALKKYLKENKEAYEALYKRYVEKINE